MRFVVSDSSANRNNTPLSRSSAVVAAESRDQDSPDYRAFMSAFPTGVTVITARDREGGPHGITCTSLCSVTLTPPTLLVSIRRTSPTLSALRSRSSFAVNLLHARGRSAAELFASPVPDRFTRLPWRLSPSLELPWLFRDAFAIAECSLKETITAGDHEVVLGEISALIHSSDVPLIYGLRQFCAWPSQLTAAEHT
jgi:flavin reductase (DIM6/NTAB) family NADH-FMN oxidoreductase RutF